MFHFRKKYNNKYNNIIPGRRQFPFCARIIINTTTNMQTYNHGDMQNDVETNWTM